MIQLIPAEESHRRLRLIAVLTAVALWIFVALLPRIDTDRRKLIVGIKVKNAPETAFLRAAPQEAEVTLEGPKAAVGKLNEQDLEVFVDLHGKLPDPARNLPVQVSGPPGVRWEISPADIHVIAP